MLCKRLRGKIPRGQKIADNKNFNPPPAGWWSQLFARSTLEIDQGISNWEKITNARQDQLFQAQILQFQFPLPMGTRGTLNSG